MDKMLFIYSTKELSAVYEELSNYSFLSLTVMVKNSNTSKNVDRFELENHAIDLTTFFSDTRNGRWHKGVIEEYIEDIDSNFYNTAFLLNREELSNFKEMYPFLIPKDNYRNLYVEDDSEILNEAKEKVTLSLNCLCKSIMTYQDVNEVIEKYSEKVIINFSQLVKDFNGLSANFNIDIFEKDTAYVIDMTSLVEYLKLRSDQKFVYELIINELVRKDSIEFIIKDALSENLNEQFPFIFKKVEKSASNNKNESEEIILMEGDLLRDVIDTTNELSKHLQGHDIFIEAFKLNLFKFKLLNKINRRKILSIFICGKSGIGKTEFARVVSKTMYPEASQIKLNFGNYSTEGVLNSLIGSPLGYVGSENGGELINKVKASESKVILIDEFEKADGKVFNFFYELLEDASSLIELGISMI